MVIVYGLPAYRDARAAIRGSTLACTDMWMCAIAWAGMDAHAGAAMSGPMFPSFLSVGSCPELKIFVDSRTSELTQWRVQAMQI